MAQLRDHPAVVPGSSGTDLDETTWPRSWLMTVVMLNLSPDTLASWLGTVKLGRSREGTHAARMIPCLSSQG